MKLQEPETAFLRASLSMPVLVSLACCAAIFMTSFSSAVRAKEYRADVVFAASELLEKLDYKIWNNDNINYEYLNISDSDKEVFDLSIKYLSDLINVNIAKTINKNDKTRLLFVYIDSENFVEYIKNEFYIKLFRRLFRNKVYAKCGRNYSLDLIRECEMSVWEAALGDLENGTSYSGQGFNEEGYLTIFVYILDHDDMNDTDEKEYNILSNIYESLFHHVERGLFDEVAFDSIMKTRLSRDLRRRVNLTGRLPEFDEVLLMLAYGRKPDIRSEPE